jgi:hypothetical protein
VSEIIRDELNQHMANSAFIDYGGNTRILFFDSVGITAAKLDRAELGPVVTLARRAQKTTQRSSLRASQGR